MGVGSRFLIRSLGKRKNRVQDPGKVVSIMFGLIVYIVVWFGILVPGYGIYAFSR